MKKHLLFIFYMCLVVHVATAQESIANGIIHEKTLNEPLLNVSVLEEGTINETEITINRELLFLVNSYQII